MGVFSKYKLNGAKPGKSYTYFNPDFEYLAEIVRLEIVSMRAGKGDLFCAEFKVLESNDPMSKTGDLRNVAWKMSLDSTPGNIVGLLAAATGVDPSNEEALASEDWDALGEASVDEKGKAETGQPLAGEKVRVITKDRVKDKGNPQNPDDHYTMINVFPA